MDGIGVIAAVVHDVLKTESFGSIVDLVDEVKWRCARLSIPYDSGRVTEAIRLVERTRPVLVNQRAPRPRIAVDHTERIDDAQPLTRAEAADIWPRLVAALQRDDSRRVTR